MKRFIFDLFPYLPRYLGMILNDEMPQVNDANMVTFVMKGNTWNDVEVTTINNTDKYALRLKVNHNMFAVEDENSKLYIISSKQAKLLFASFNLLAGITTGLVVDTQTKAEKDVNVSPDSGIS